MDDPVDSAGEGAGYCTFDGGSIGKSGLEVASSRVLMSVDLDSMSSGGMRVSDQGRQRFFTHGAPAKRITYVRHTWRGALK